jgi:glycerophosphoryl diester phosphodiesterase
MKATSSASIRHPWCIAHRGARKEAPENTRSAFLRALSYPVDGIELDVQMSADGIPVLYHDRTLQRAGGGRRRIADLTLDQLRLLDWGGRFHPQYAGEPLMTLDLLLAMLDRCPRWFIEIKSRPGERESGHSFRLTEKVVAMIGQPRYRALQNRLYLLSFDAEILALAHRLAPALRKVRNLAPGDVETDIGDTRHLWAVDVPIQKLNPSIVQWARDRDLHIMTYTCNGPGQVARAVRLGVDAVISDRPGWLAGQLKRFAR